MQQEESALMQKATSSSENETTLTPKSNISTISTNDKFVPTQEQIDALSLRLLPEIKKFFADKQIQNEFIAWKEKLEKKI